MTSPDGPKRLRPLADAVALVAGATRGTGRALAVELAAAGATVYATGRTTRARRSPLNRPESIEETAELARGAGGKAIALAVDHTDPAAVAELVARIGAEQDGRLDLVVNDVWGGDPLTEWGPPFWEHDLANGLALWSNALEAHLITAWHAAPLLVARRRGLIVEMTDGVSEEYRGSLFYDLTKDAGLRLAKGMAHELRPHGVAAVAVSPGFLRSEAVLDHFGVTEATWRDAIARDEHFAHSETPRFVARGVAALAADPAGAGERSGSALGSWDLARRYGIEDVDGRRPDWGAYFATIRHTLQPA